MPITKQAIKKVRQDKRKTRINQKIKFAAKKAVVEFRKKPSASSLSNVFSVLDRAAKTNVIHKNKAARLKSRLSKLVAVKRQVKALKPPTKKSSRSKPPKKSLKVGLNPGR